MHDASPTPKHQLVNKSVCAPQKRQSLGLVRGGLVVVDQLHLAVAVNSSHKLTQTLCNVIAPVLKQVSASRRQMGSNRTTLAGLTVTLVPNRGNSDFGTYQG